MALRQMSIARMGEYRPPVRSVSEGGRTGRMKLLHNGPGNGLSGGGGTNASGSAGGIKVPAHMRGAQRKLRKQKYASNKTNALKMADRRREADKRQKDQTKGGTSMAPHPVGRFQYGQDQWGFINARGLVNWKSTAPNAKTQPVIGFNQALPYLRAKGALTRMPTRQATTQYYLDPLYARQMAQHNQERDQRLADLDYQKGLQQRSFLDGNQQLTNDYLDANGQAMLGLSSGNIAGSGVANSALSSLASKFQDALGRASLSNDVETTNTARQQKLVTDSYNAAELGEAGVAKERWLATHPGQQAPVPQKGLWKDAAGHQMYTSPQGIPSTFTPAKKPAKPATSVAAGQFKGAKSFKDAQGNIRQIGSGKILTPAKGKK